MCSFAWSIDIGGDKSRTTQTTNLKKNKEMIHRLKHRVCRTLLLALAVLSPLFVLTSCHGDDGADADIAETNNTLLMYMPWTGDKNTLTSYFWTNISDMKKAYSSSGMSGSQQVVVFISTSGTDGYMFNISDYRGHDSASSLPTVTSLLPS